MITHHTLASSLKVVEIVTLKNFMPSKTIAKIQISLQNEKPFRNEAHF